MRFGWGGAVAIALATVLLGQGGPARSEPKRPAAPKGAQVYFEYPYNGAVVGRRLTVKAGLHHMGVAPAGVEFPATGHHHLLIDTDLHNLNEPIPVNNSIIHLSNGETEVRITLSPGRHTLRLVLADANHMNFQPPIMSDKITITVRARDPDHEGR